MNRLFYQCFNSTTQVALVFLAFSVISTYPVNSTLLSTAYQVMMTQEPWEVLALLP